MNNTEWSRQRAVRHESRVNTQRAHPAEPQASYYHPAHHGGQADYADHVVPPYQQPPAESAGAGEMGRVLHGAGALLSVAMIAGLGVWGYQLAMRDVTGVPVVRALEGPMRIQPDDPGGVAAAHQGLAVNAVAAEGQAAGPVPQIALAPAPMALEDEDIPARTGAEVSVVPMAEAEETLPAEVVQMGAQTAALTEEDADPEAAALALASALAAGVSPLSGEAADLTMTPEAAERFAVVTVPASVPGVARSPRPKQRPDDIVARAAASPVDLALASASAAAPASVREVDAGQLAAGTRLVQLGAFDSQEVARAEWEKVAMRFPEMLEGKDRVIEQAQSGGKTFYRLRAMGFENLSDARRFCAALMAGQAACIPVVTR